MDRPYRIVFWTTSFGPDQIALAWHLDQRSDFDVRVVVSDPASVAREPSLHRRPLSAPLLGRGPLFMMNLRRFRPDVVVVDNGVPWLPLAPAGLVQWHGYGWKGPDAVRDMVHRYLTLSAHWGSPLRPTARLRWACFGPQDFEHRTTVGGLHPAICPQVGAASHDVLRRPLDRRVLADHYPVDVVNRRNVLLAPTWHYGGVLGHWGREEELLDDLIGRARRHGANVILRLHDRWRVDESILSVVEGLARRWDNVVLKFKNEHPDGLADLRIADVLVTNMSSIANLFYATLRPTIHVFPVADEAAPFQRRRLWFGRVQTQDKGTARDIWKMSPENNGGMLARSQRELLAQLDRALEDPDCCADRAREFLDQYMLSADGRSCDRLRAVITELAHAPNPLARASSA